MGSYGARRYAFIDAVRGMAACLVLLQHSLENSGLEEIMPGMFGLSWLNLGESGVLAFFIVSGFVIPLSLEKWNSVRHFVINRIFRIYPLYIVIYLCTLSIVGLSSFHSGNEIFLSAAAHLFFLQQYFNITDLVNNSWTLSLEAVWYISFSLLFVLSFNRKNHLILTFCLIATFVVCSFSLGNLVRVPLGRFGLLLACVMGLIFFRSERDEISRRASFATLAAVLAMIGACLFVGFLLRPGTALTTPSFRCVELSWLLGFGLFLVPFLSRDWSGWRGPGLRYLGTVSYSIYLIHPPLMLILNQLPVSGAAYLAIVLPATLALASLTYRYVERPAITWAHNLLLSPARIEDRAQAIRLAVGAQVAPEPAPNYPLFPGEAPQ